MRRRKVGVLDSGGFRGLKTERETALTGREQRMVENEELFRTANERLQEHVAERVASDQHVPFLCECTDDLCMARIELTLDEYARVRADANHFVIEPGHPMMERERVVGQNQRFWVVEKPA
jgi:hypothetical protein